MITIYVLDNGELFRQLLNASSAFIYSSGFKSVLAISAFFGIVFTLMKYLKSRDPSLFAYWFATYMIVITFVIAPKTEVQIEDVSQQLQALKVDNVPVVFAIGAKILTKIGFGLAQTFDMLMSMPDDMKYTKTGMLFGSHMMTQMHKTRIQNSDLKAEFSDYFRNCVVGDVRLLHKYSLHDLRSSGNVSSTIFDDTSKLRRTILRDGSNVSCADAAVKIKASLDQEINNTTYHSLWSRLIGKQVEKNRDNPDDSSSKDAKYKDLIGRYIETGTQEFQGLRDSSTNLLRQTLLINAIDDGVKDYQAYTNSESGLVNYNYSKSQVQHRNSWIVMGKKASWFLPLQHTMLLIIMFGLFPIMLALSITPLGGQVFKEYAAFFLSLQLWPVIFAIINLAMTYYGKKHAMPYGSLTIANIDSVDQVHSDIAGIAGYSMFIIPSIAYGLISKGIGSAMMHNANSMNSHTQGSAMSIASEIAGGNISVGQSSYMNTNANNLSLNKHDSNWTDMNGMSTSQLDSGLTLTQSANGHEYANSSQAISQGAFSITDTTGLQNSLTKASDKSIHSVNSHQSNFNKAITHAASRMMQYGSGLGHDKRFGEGGSIGQSSSENQAISRMMGLAHDLAERTGMSQSAALSGLSSVALNAHAGFDGKQGLAGRLAGLVGFNGGVGLQGSASTSSNHSDSHQQGVDQVLSAKEFSDFKHDLNTVMNSSTNQHYDGNYSDNENLLHQIGNDLRTAESESKSYSSSLSDSQRISNALSYVSSHSDNIAHNLNQELYEYGCNKVGKSHMNDLWGSTGDAIKGQELQGLYQEYMDEKAKSMIQQHGQLVNESSINEHHKLGQNYTDNQSKKIDSNFNKDGQVFNDLKGQFKDVDQAQANIAGSIALNNHKNQDLIQQGQLDAKQELEKVKNRVGRQEREGEYLAKKGVVDSFASPIHNNFSNFEKHLNLKGDK